MLAVLRASLSSPSTLGGRGSEALSTWPGFKLFTLTWIRQFPLIIYFSGCPYVSGGTMPPCGHPASLSPLRLLTESCNSTSHFCSSYNSTSLFFPVFSITIVISYYYCYYCHYGGCHIESITHFILSQRRTCHSET